MKLSQRAVRIEPSATLAMDALTNQMVKQGVDVVNFTVGQPDYDTPDNVKDSGIAAIQAGFTKYTPASGIPELKEAVCAKLHKDNGLEYAPNQVVICVGAKHALYNIFQVLLDPGDEVIVPAPYWVSYLEQVRLAEGKPVVISAGEEQGFKVTADQMRAAVTPNTKALILNSPSNPTGAVYSRSELEEIARVCIEKQIIVVSDEIYEPFTYTGTNHVGIAQLGEEIKALTLIVHGVSKSHSMTGWRIGYVVGNKDVITAIGSLQSHSTSNPTSIAQKAALEALNGPQDSVQMMVQAFRTRRDYMVQRLNQIPGIRCAEPQGAFYVFPNVSDLIGKTYKGQQIADSAQLAQLLLTEARVALVPGNAFGASDNVRISYATSMARIEAGLDRITEFVNQLA
ncbi:MAG TPA: pyridoxal phosphate-dependent aminotransferase [Firmicutes bacterium]|jgi:aspartate aminotransferase|nr:pyridoxal phosphate-dependent aminotransferase [Bacillota bacterium]